MPSSTLSPLLLLGGSFNPPHAGHMRIAIESAEALNPDRTLFIPCAVPPHKSGRGLMPFALRCAMLRAAIADMDSPLKERFAVSEVENEREGYSYTWDTLTLLAQRFPGLRPAFVMGGEDYARFATWRNWQRMPELADLVILPRSAGGEDLFRVRSREFWPEARETDLSGSLPAVRAAFVLPCGGRLLYLPQPLLDVSSSMLRERLSAGRSLDFLVPPGVLRLLDEHRQSLLALWKS